MKIKEIDLLLQQHNLQEQVYIGDQHNNIQRNFLINKTQSGRITIIGDLLNDYDDNIRSNIWFFKNSDIIDSPHDRSIVLYYKNEPPNKKTIDEEEFLLYYKVLERMINLKLLKSFNKIKIICRDSVPIYYNTLSCEKHITEMGSKQFDIYCNVYSNTVFLTTSTANHHIYGSKAIVSRNVYEMKKVNKLESILFNYIYCPIDMSDNYVDGDEFVWDDNTKSTYSVRFNSFKETQLGISRKDKLDDFIKCILSLDSSPVITKW
jgi:hypothetical protein